MLPPSYDTLAGFKQRTIMPAGDVEALTRVLWTRKESDGDALHAMPELAAGYILVDANLVQLRIVPVGFLAADDTNYATISVYKRTDGGARILIGAVTTQIIGGTGDWSPGIAVSIPLSLNVVLADDQLTIAATKTGTGVVVPKFTLVAVPDATYIDLRSGINSASINARLIKRYDVPITMSPVPEKILGWLEAMNTRDAYMKRGFNPGSAQDEEILARAARAEAEQKEAADSKDGLFELPILDATGASAVNHGGPLFYGESSPFVSADMQERAGVLEDVGGFGTMGGR